MRRARGGTDPGPTRDSAEMWGGGGDVAMWDTECPTQRAVAVTAARALRTGQAEGAASGSLPPSVPPCGCADRAAARGVFCYFFFGGHGDAVWPCYPPPLSKGPVLAKRQRA